jgi:hypothetical protein
MIFLLLQERLSEEAPPTFPREPQPFFEVIGRYFELAPISELHIVFDVFSWFVRGYFNQVQFVPNSPNPVQLVLSWLMENCDPASLVPSVCRVIQVLRFFASRFRNYIDGTTYEQLLGLILALLPPLDGPVEAFCESPILVLMFEVGQFRLPISGFFSQVCRNCRSPIIHYALTCLERIEGFPTLSLPLRAAHFLSSWTLAIPRQIADHDVIQNRIMTLLFQVALSRGTPDFILHAIRPLSCAAVSVVMEPKALLDMLMRAAMLQQNARAVLEESPDKLWTNHYIAKRSVSLDHPRNCAISALRVLPEVWAHFWEYQPNSLDELEVYIRFAAELIDDDHIELGFALYQVDCDDDRFCLFSKVYLLVRMSTLSQCPPEFITNEMVPLGVALVRDACADYSEWGQSARPSVFSIGCHLLDAVRRVIDFRLADDLIEQIAYHRSHCLGSHADTLLTAAIRQGQLDFTPELLCSMLSRINDDEIDDVEYDVFELFKAVFRRIRDADIHSCAFYISRFWEYLRETGNSNSYMKEIAEIFFELFDQNWEIDRNLRLGILVSIFQGNLCLPPVGEEIWNDECAIMSTLVCRLAQSLQGFGEAEAVIMNGFNSLIGHVTTRLFKSANDESSGPSCYGFLIPCEIEMTLFLCGCCTFEPPRLVEMRDRGFIPSNYHRRLVESTIDKLRENGIELIELNAILDGVHRQPFIGNELLEEQEFLDLTIFDKWDSPL